MLNKVTPTRQKGAASHVSSTSMGSEKQPRASHESHLNQLSAHENAHANLLLPTSLVVLMACAKNWGTPDSIANTQTSQSQTAANWWHTHHRHPSSALCRDQGPAVQISTQQRRRISASCCYDQSNRLSRQDELCDNTRTWVCPWADLGFSSMETPATAFSMFGDGAARSREGALDELEEHSGA